ncbi:RNA ligase family protein [Streptomyces sp. MBT33]|uniref:ATP-dependent DNA ligase n=1 Tax=Streptomyces sp. MBT33 TaxID=1488363 RepID=UPI00190AB437|nr:RNA ligase family protein [Streptomyces sp. MBT33]MBK3643041.1 DNA ligase [Streptomyces sp. MBT33]
MDFPVDVALAELVPTLPVGAGWRYEMKLDGHRTVVWREEDTVRLQARSGRDVTAVWMDLALAALDMLPPGVVLDGEAVIYAHGRVDFAAAQSRALSTPARARRLSEALPAHFAAWDILSHPEHGDVRARPYDERRALLADLLQEYNVKPPIQLVPMTDDPTVAMTWYQQLPEQGIEGIVAKRATSTYKAGRIWKKIRHAETVEADVVGYTGPAARPRALAVRLPDGRIALTQSLKAPLAAQVAVHCTASGPPRGARTRVGEPYTTTAPGLVVEVLAGTTRHAVVTVTRLRST